MRTIEGQATLQARTTHDIGIDTVHDEIVVPNPFAQAILFFRGGARGEEPPIRIIQGPKTMLGYTDNVTVDPIHNEVFVAQFRTDAILVFRRDAGGDVAPVRIIHGPKTRLDRPVRLSVDPVNNILAVTSMAGLWVFNRTDQGDVAPRAVIAGPKTGIGGANALIMKPLVYPEGKKIFVAGGSKFSKDGVRRGRVAVWKYGDNGDMAPWAVIPGSPITKLGHTNGGVALNPADEEVMVLSGGGVLVFHAPELFQGDKAADERR